MSIPPSQIRAHPVGHGPHDRPAPRGAISICEFGIFSGLLAVLSLALIACSPAPPTPSVDRSSLRTDLARRAFATNSAYALTAAPSATLPPPVTDTPTAPPTSSPTAPPASPLLVTTSPPDTPANPSISQALGYQTKTSGCVSAFGLPDPACSPGAVEPNATTDQICAPGYSSGVGDVPDALGNQVYAEYGIASYSPGQYEIDHIIPLDLGGSNDISNLFPEAADPRPGFHEKDLVENWLHDQVCSGAILLPDAQFAIARNWLQFCGQRLNPEGGTPCIAAQAPPAPVPRVMSGQLFVTGYRERTYYYCETDPAWRQLNAYLVWSDDPGVFIARGLKLHRLC